MKYLMVTIILIFWLLTTLLLVVSIVGLIAIMTDGWLSFPDRLLDVFK